MDTPNTASASPWLTRDELAERLKLPKKTLDQWAYLGKGPRHAKIGRNCRYLLADVEQWEKEQFNQAG